MPKRRARLFPFDVGWLVRLIVAVSLPLISLLVTLQLTWTAVESVSFEYRSPALWIIPEGSSTSLSEALFGSRFAERTIDTERDQINLTVLAPPNKPLTLGRNGQPVTFPRQATGKYVLEDVRLRRGINEFYADLDSGTDVNRSDKSTSLRVRSRQAPPEPPRILARWWTARNRIAVLGSVEPTTTVVLRAADVTNGVPSDEHGFFLAFLDVDEAHVGAQMTAETTGAAEAASVPRLENDEFVSPAQVIRRNVALTVSERDWKLSVTAEVPLDSRLHTDVAQGFVGAEVFLREVFGLCFMPVPEIIGGRRTFSGSLRTAFSCYDFNRREALEIPVAIDKKDRAILHFEFTERLGDAPLTLAYSPETNLSASFLILPHDSMRLTRSSNARVTIQSSSATSEGALVDWPIEPKRAPWSRRENDLVTFRRSANEDNTDDDKATGGSNENRVLDRPPAGRIIDRIFALQSYVPERIRRLISTLVSSIPFFVFIWILNRFPGRRSSHAATLKAVTVTFLLMHVTLAALALFEAVLTPSMLAFVDDLSPRAELSRAIMVLRGATHIYPFLGIGIVLLVNPVFKAVRHDQIRRTEFARRRVWRAVGWVLFWAAVALFPCIAVYSGMRGGLAESHLERLPTVALLLGTGLCGLWFVLFWLLRGVLQIGVRVRDAVLATWAVLLLPLVPPLVNAVNDIARRVVATQIHFYPLLLPERASPYISVAIVAVLGAILLFQTIKLSIRLSQHTGAWRWFLHQRRRLLIGLVVISVPVITGPYEANVAYTIIQAFYLLDRLLPFALLIGAATLVRLLNRRDSFDVSPGEIYVGTLVFAWYVSGHSATLLFIPVPFLLAWFLFRHWLVGREQHAAASPALVRKFIEDRHAKSRLENLQKGLDKALGEGELKLSEYQERLKEGQEAAASLAAGSDGSETRILAGGPEGGPWQNAWTAVRYGFFLSLPFQLVTLVRMLSEDSPDFPFLEFTYALVFSVATWVVMAAIFGYFYHLIKGSNGFEKGLCYSLAVVGPTIPFQVIMGRSLADRSQLLDIVQVFAFTLVLALVAFDLRTLQKHRYGWRDLFTVYGLASAAYGSTIAVAVVSTVGGRELLPKIWDLVKWLAGTSG